MSLNCNELNLILSELDLEGSFIQEITQPGYDVLTMRCINGGKTFTVLICTAQNSCRMHATQTKAVKNPKPLRFYEFLRSHVQGMRINSARQLGLDRIIKLDVSTWKERLFIYVRLWSNAANVIVTDESGIIQDCMYRRPKKNEVSGAQLTVQERIPDDKEREESLERFPVRDFRDFQEQFKSLHPDKDFSALTFNQKIDAYYSEHAAGLSRESLLAQAEKWYGVRRSRMQGALERLLEKQKSFKNAESLRHTGDLILAYAADAKGNFLDCTDYDTGEKVHIRLDSAKNPQQNAAHYYEQYKKAVSGLEELEHDIERAERNIKSLDDEYKSMLAEKNVLRLEQMIRRESTPRQSEEKPHPGLHYEADGWIIMVGRTAAENDDLLRHNVRGNDMWLHTRDCAGGYVFIKARSGKTVPLDILLYAGNLAVYHSKARQNGEADLYYTQVKYLRRAKNGPKGLVLPTHEKNLFVKIDAARLRRLEEMQSASRGI